MFNSKLLNVRDFFVIGAIALIWAWLIRKFTDRHVDGVTEE